MNNNQEGTVRRPVNWTRVRKVAGLTAAAWITGLLLALIPLATAGKQDSDGSFSVALEGPGAGSVLLGLALLIASTVAFIPAVIAAARTVTTGVGATNATQAAHQATSHVVHLDANTTLTPHESDETGNAQLATKLEGNTATQRRLLAKSGKNMLGLQSRWPRRSRFLNIGAVLGAFGLMGAIVIVSSGQSGQQEGKAIPGLVGMSILTLAIGAYAARLYLSGNSYRDRYTELFNSQPSQTRQQGHATIESRRWTDVTQPIETDGYEQDSPTEQAQHNLLTRPTKQPVDRWAEALWRRHGPMLLAREIEMIALARNLGTQTSALATHDTPAPAPYVLVNQGRSAALYQQRNVLIADDEEYPVYVVDLVLLSKTLARTFAGPRNYAPVVQTSTYVETWFPADHWIHVYPRSRTGLLLQGGPGKRIEVHHKPFGRKYNAYTDKATWAGQALTATAMRVLVDLHPVRFSLDAGRAVLHSHSGWETPERITRMVRGLKSIARSIEEADNH